MSSQDTNTIRLADIATAMTAVTEAAAISASKWIGLGRKEDGDGAAVKAMRTSFNEQAISATIVIGEGEKDEAPMLYAGEELGLGGPAIDIAIDPVEGTTLLAKGMPGAIAVLAAAPANTMFRPGPAFYMNKLVVPPAARGAIDPNAPVDGQLKALGKAVGKPVSELRVFVLERPRHEKLIREIRATGASCRLVTDGDVLGSLFAVLGDRVDALMGVGGTPEGVISACIARALGGDMFGTMAPQSDEERKTVEEFGLKPGQILTRDELVSSDEVVFAATGITGDDLLGGVRTVNGRTRTETLLIGGGNQMLRWITTDRILKG